MSGNRFCAKPRLNKSIAFLLAVVLLVPMLAVMLPDGAAAPGEVDVVDRITLSTDRVWAVPPTPQYETFYEWKTGGVVTQKPVEISWWEMFMLDIEISDTKVVAGGGKLKSGDWFSVIIPDIFYPVEEKIDAPFYADNDTDKLAGTYSLTNITAGSDIGKKELLVVFGSYVDTHIDIAGEFHVSLNITDASTGTKTPTFEFAVSGVAGALVVGGTGGVITLTPPPVLDYNYEKYGAIYVDSATGKPVTAKIGTKDYIVFEWILYVNLQFDHRPTLELDDELFGGHIFIDDNTPTSKGGFVNTVLIYEYTGLDDPSLDSAGRKAQFPQKYFEDDLWTHNEQFIIVDGSYVMPNGSDSTLPGLDSNPNMRLVNFSRIEDKMTVKLSNVTRPFVLRYYTVATYEYLEADLENDSEMSKIANSFYEGSTELKHAVVHAISS